MQNLMLTTPNMRSNAVRNAQLLLNDNQFGDFYEGEVDSTYGTLTAQAVYRAKYWLGYRKPNQVYGDSLRKHLLGEAKLTPLMKLRRKQRLKKQNETPMREKAFFEAEKWIGVKEHPANSNIARPFTPWYLGSDRWGTPWCMIFVSWNYVKGANSKVFKAGKYYAYCPYMQADAKAGRNNLTVTKNPKKGDIVLLDFNGDGVPDHVELFHKWTVARSQFMTIGGNTSINAAGSQSNGGAVARKERSIHNVTIFVHVGR